MKIKFSSSMTKIGVQAAIKGWCSSSHQSFLFLNFSFNYSSFDYFFLDIFKNQLVLLKINMGIGIYFSHFMNGLVMKPKHWCNSKEGFFFTMMTFEFEFLHHFRNIMTQFSSYHLRYLPGISVLMPANLVANCFFPRRQRHFTNMASRIFSGIGNCEVVQSSSKSLIDNQNNSW